MPNVYFTAPDTIVTSISQNYSTLNQSINCQNYQWDFGDGLGSSLDFEPTYSYVLSGTYKTKLIGTSSTGCLDSTEKYTTVINLATNTMLKAVQNIKLINMGSNKFKIIAGSVDIQKLFISMSDLNGKTILDQNHTLQANEELTLDLSGNNPGIYVLSIGEKDKVLRSLKIYIE